MKSKLGHSVGSILGFGLFISALLILGHELKTYDYKDIIGYLEELPSFRLLSAILLTAVAYLVMTGYDALALRYTRHALPFGKTALTSFIAFTFSMNMGFAMIAGSSVRYRLYSAWGLSALQITRVVGFCIVALWLGFFMLAGAVFLVQPMRLPAFLHLPLQTTQPVGAVFLALVLVFSLWGISRKRAFQIRGWEFFFPPAHLFFAQVGLATLDWTLAGTLLYALLPQPALVSFAAVISIYLLAQTAGLISQIPGGLGVFETVALLLLSPTLPPEKVLGALLVYRGIYYLLPLILAAALLGVQEILIQKKILFQFAQNFGKRVSGLIPHILSLATFIGGGVFLLTCATPSIGPRIEWLNRFISLPVLELSHFAGTLIGMGLMILAQGIRHRLAAAYLMSVTFMVVGTSAFLLRGLDYEEAAVLLLVLLALLPARRHFYRKVSLFSQRFGGGWFAAFTVVVIFFLWLGWFSFKHVSYAHSLWWRFSLHDDFPRFLRSTIGVLIFAVTFFIAKRLRPSVPVYLFPKPEDIKRVGEIVAASPRASAALALMGDKMFFFNPMRNAFIMYGIEGRSWISMGDPVGPQTEWYELIWRFQEMCHSYNGWAVFYGVSDRYASLYQDLDLSLMKIGEEARVPLNERSLGKMRRDTKQSDETPQYRFEVIPQDRVLTFLPELKSLSEAWIKWKGFREKGFSAGFFDAAYLSRFPVGMVYHGETPVAFSTIWRGGHGEEISADLIRHIPDPPPGLLDYLFVELMRWGKQQGFRHCNMGLTPQADSDILELGPLWKHVGTAIYRYGEHFEHLETVRTFKEKYKPEWQAVYLAFPGPLVISRIFSNLAFLFSQDTR